MAERDRRVQGSRMTACFSHLFWRNVIHDGWPSSCPSLTLIKHDDPIPSIDARYAQYLFQNPDAKGHSGSAIAKRSTKDGKPCGHLPWQPVTMVMSFRPRVRYLELPQWLNCGVLRSSQAGTKSSFNQRRLTTSAHQSASCHFAYGVPMQKP
ncbi:hypothetical protein CC80DRAFT_490859 [Byssothecium circinans]|uniref:Uncharacterized protein n=1 Tax=Byssothecium circinans TaxID=147558 RepID=A0A6A5U5I5_9PLEO|nr:hypothetical protein CC80DRAFT_490859 [Byssothecium circinans]